MLPENCGRTYEMTHTTSLLAGFELEIAYFKANSAALSDTIDH